MSEKRDIFVDDDDDDIKTDENVQDDAQNTQQTTQQQVSVPRKSKKRPLVGLNNAQADTECAELIFGTGNRSKAYVKDFNLTDLLDHDKAQDFLHTVTIHLETLKVNENACRAAEAAQSKDPNNKKNYPRLKQHEDFVPMPIIAEALVATGDFKILDEKLNNTLATCRYLMRKYDGYSKTDMWKVIELDEKNLPKEILQILKNLCGTMTKKQTSDYVNAIRSAFFSELPRATNSLQKFNNKVVPCHNGVFDKIEGDDKPRFIEWADIDLLNQIYGPDFAFTWCLRVDYKPDAVCPAYRDPFDVINSVFDTEKNVGKASANIIKQGMQFSIRGTSGGTGHMVWLCNDSHCAGGSNGKTTIMDLDKSMFTDCSQSELVCSANMADLFSGDFGSSQLIGPIIYMGDEQDKAMKDTGAFKNFVRNQDVPVQRKYMPNIMIKCPGYKVQCLNELPKMGGKNMAIYRGNIFLKLEKDFSEHSPDRDPYLITDYVWQTDVAEYILSRLCDMPFVDDYDSSDIAAVECNKWDVIEENDSAMKAIIDLLPQFCNADLIPVHLMYDDCYPGWCRQAYGNREGDRYVVTFKNFSQAADELSRSGQIDYVYMPNLKRNIGRRTLDKSYSYAPLPAFDYSETAKSKNLTDYNKWPGSKAWTGATLNELARAKQWKGFFVKRDYYAENYLHIVDGTDADVTYDPEDLPEEEA